MAFYFMTSYELSACVKTEAWIEVLQTGFCPFHSTPPQVRQCTQPIYAVGKADRPPRTYVAWPVRFCVRESSLFEASRCHLPSILKTHSTTTKAQYYQRRRAGRLQHAWRWTSRAGHLAQIASPLFRAVLFNVQRSNTSSYSPRPTKLAPFRPKYL